MLTFSQRILTSRNSVFRHGIKNWKKVTAIFLFHNSEVFSPHNSNSKFAILNFSSEVWVSISQFCVVVFCSCHGIKNEWGNCNILYHTILTFFLLNCEFLFCNSDLQFRKKNKLWGINSLLCDKNVNCEKKVYYLFFKIPWPTQAFTILHCFSNS